MFKNNKKNIYILNYWWAANYGANLTAFALNKLIENSVLVDNKDIVQYICESKFSFHKNFEKKYLKFVDKFITSINNEESIYITGSDQVFRPNINKNISSDYFLDFVNSNSKKISVSASFGVNKELFLKENSSEVIEQIKKSLQTFDFISVRETSGIEICKEVLGVSAEWIIDPVFILDKDRYSELLHNSTKDYSNKIVSYMINSYVGNYHGEKTVELFKSNESVENWLNAIKTCKLFITNSFHGVCFAIIFNKPFVCIVNSETGGARYNSLFEMLGIENQCISDINEIYEKDCIFNFDWNWVNEQINYERQRGLEFLQKALDAPVGKQKEKEEVRTIYLEEKVIKLEQQANLKYQLKKELWNLWLVIWHKYLPEPIKTIIRLARNKYVRK